MELSPWRMQPGYFHVIADPVSTCVHEIFEFLPRHARRLVMKLKIPPRPSSSPGYQFWMVEYLIVASSSATSSTTAACSWFSSRTGAFFFQAEDGIRDYKVTGVQTCALPI